MAPARARPAAGRSPAAAAARAREARARAAERRARVAPRPEARAASGMAATSSVAPWTPNGCASPEPTSATPRTPGRASSVRPTATRANATLPTFDPSVGPAATLASGVTGYEHFCQQCLGDPDCAGNRGGVHCNLDPSLVEPPILGLGFETCGPEPTSYYLAGSRSRTAGCLCSAGRGLLGPGYGLAAPEALLRRWALQLVPERPVRRSSLCHRPGLRKPGGGGWWAALRHRGQPLRLPDHQRLWLFLAHLRELPSWCSERRGLRPVKEPAAATRTASAATVGCSACHPTPRIRAGFACALPCTDPRSLPVQQREPHEPDLQSSDRRLRRLLRG